MPPQDHGNLSTVLNDAPAVLALEAVAGISSTALMCSVPRATVQDVFVELLGELELAPDASTGVRLVSGTSCHCSIGWRRARSPSDSSIA